MATSFLRGSFLVFVGLVIGKVLAMANNVVMARCLQPDEFGVFLLGISIFEFLRIPSSLGLPSFLPKLVAEFKTKREFDKLEHVLSLALGYCLILAIPITLSVYIISPYISIWIFNEPRLVVVLKILLIALPFSVVLSLVLSFYRGNQITRGKILYENICPPFLKTLFFIIIFWIGGGGGGASASFAYVLSVLLVVLIIIIDLRVSFDFGVDVNFKKSDLRKTLFVLSWPLMFQSVAWIIYTRVDRLFLGYYLTSAEVGIYGAAASIATLLSLIPQCFSFLSLPIFSKILAGKSTLEFRRVYGKISLLMFLISLPIFLCLAMFSGDILLALYGNEYTTGRVALLLLAGGVLSKTLVGPVSDSLISAGKTKVPLIFLCAGCCVNIVLNILLIPKFGINGAAFATCGGMFTSTLVGGYLNYRYLGVFSFNYFYLLWGMVCFGLMQGVFWLDLFHVGGWGRMFFISSIYLALVYSSLLCVGMFTCFGKAWILELRSAKFGSDHKK